MFWGNNNSILGLDIGSSHIKIVHLKRYRQNWKLENRAIVKTPTDAISDGNISNKDELVRVLTDTIAKHKFQERKVVTAVSNMRIVTRYITMPPMPEKELKEAVNWEAKNHIPIYDENMKIDFRLLRKTDDNRTRLVIAGISKQTASEYLDMLTDARLKPVAIDIYPVSLQRFFGGSDSSRPYSIVDLGAVSTKLVIIKEDSVYADSLIAVGIKDIQRNIIDYFGIQGEELASWQESFSLRSLRDKQEHAELFRILAPSLNELTDGINRFIKFFDTQNRNQTVAKLVLTGGGALWKGIGDFIGQETGIPTSTVEPELTNPTLDTSTLGREELHLLSNAVGLAMRGVVY